MGKIILFPTHPDYCKRCIYSRNNGTCASEKYNENQYKVNCVWHYCKYRKAKERKDKAKKRVNELFGSGAEKPVAEDVVNLLIATVDAIEDKHMKGITVDVGHGVKAKVSKMAKESIKVERSENKKTTYEE